MSKTILFVCQSCRATHTETSDSPAEGAMLLKQLQELHPEWSGKAELEIQSVGCLWTCDHPCAIALSSPEKSTYMLAKVPVTEGSIKDTAEAVLCLSQLYLDSRDGTIPWKHFPEVLQTDIIARIPPLTANSESKS
ncbi:MAG TPA: DUF1636 domain-containing protein [Leptolyngbyaceae cyanobacterium M33_DOE_097]|uniref:DUF1636 domain-containing protein n=1 Tax=Oscillatoriales cyanobacterium SpSt-418 TaxID=2282169 RepID=A0A7C3PE35_9CYAN|nr:DUF1636 domain-containing protein [Leptolyngbyaceae cyanobacterium M33_DOE_097]